MTTLALRPALDSDAPVLTELFVAARRAPFDASGLAASAVTSLLRQQYGFQTAGYRASYPGAAWEAIVAGRNVVGRLVTDTNQARAVLVDIVVAPLHQRSGVGSWALGEVLGRAGERPVELSVDLGSPAEAWYRRAGFEPLGDDGVQLHMVRQARVGASR